MKITQAQQDIQALQTKRFKIFTRQARAANAGRKTVAIAYSRLLVKINNELKALMLKENKNDRLAR